MGLWNDYVAICINKGSKKYDRFYVTDFNFAKVYRNGCSSIFKSQKLGQKDSDFDMGLWNDYVVMCIKKFNFKGSKSKDESYSRVPRLSDTLYSAKGAKGKWSL